MFIQAMAAILKSQEQAKSATDDHAHKLKDEIRTLKADRSLLEQKVLEMEAVSPITPWREQ